MSYGMIILEVAQARCIFDRALCDRDCFVSKVDLFFEIGNVGYHIVNLKVEFVVQAPHQWFRTVMSNFSIRDAVIDDQVHYPIFEIAVE